MTAAAPWPAPGNRGRMTDAMPQRPEAAHTLSGGGELGALMRATDWAQTPLGPPEHWPQSLKTCVRIVLTSRQPMFVWWGEALINLYNDAYRTIVGGKHPQALGQPASVVWREIWDQVGPRAETAMRRDEGTYDEALLLIMERYGYPEETYYTFSYSPVPNDQGGTGGIICANTDDTQRIIGERQLALLKELGTRTAEARTVAGACRAAALGMHTNPRDLPFALIYLLDPEHHRLTLAGATGIAAGHPAAPESVALDAAAVWPFAEVLRSGAPAVVPVGGAAFGALPSGAWDRPPQHAVALPLPRQGETGRTGVLVVGLNRYRQFDAAYEGFLGLVAGQVAAGIANAHAYEIERERAEALAEIDRAKTLFFSNVSHEFRTPLTLILAPLEDVLNDAAAALTAGQRRQLDVVHRNSLRLLKLVNTLLDFSRIEAGRVQASYQATDLAALTADLASNFRSATDRVGLALHIDCAPLPEPVFVDRDMGEKVVLNLLSNAFKFTFAGEIAVSLHADGQHAVLRVRDTGVGIPPEELPRLFERFHRIEGQRSRSFEGSGIGLALVHELVRLHGGHIAAESATGSGTSFTVALPFGTAHLPAERIGAATTDAGVTTRAEAYVQEALHWLPEIDAGGIDIGGHTADSSALTGDAAARATVLLADDNADMREYVRRLLGERYQVVAVADGVAALQAMRQRRPDLLLSDVMMPGLDGFGLLRAVRADPALRDVPVILLSARAGEEARAEGLEAGADDYLTKPFAARELLARVGANLAMSRVRQEAVQAALDSADRLRQMFEQAPGFMCMLRGPEHVFDLANAAYLRLIGCRDVIGKPVRVAVPEVQGQGFFELLDRVYRSGEPYVGHGMRILVRQDGRPVERFVDFVYQPIRDGAGNVIGLFVEGADATERVRAEQALREVNDRLEARVAERTAELRQALDQLHAEALERQRAEAALRQAQKMEAIGQLTGGIAHDFNNLLTGIGGSLELLQTRAAQGRTGEIARYVTAAMTSVTRAAALTHRLLAFARRQALDPKPTNCNRLVAGMEELIRRTVGPAIQIETVLAAGLWSTLCDANQLESALLNLCINARDAMPEGGRLTIETANAYLDEAYAATERDVRPGQYVSLSVSDTGTGMSADILARAFEPFYTTKPIGQGTGLGLSMLYGFVKQSEGHVRIYSEVGQGTTVRLYLPRDCSPEEAADAALANAHDAGAASAQLGETVLVVEDEAVVRALVVEVLADLGYAALEAADGPAGLRILQSDARIDLLVSDVGLPGLNGRQLADAAREWRPDLPVLFITGYAHNAAIGNGFLAPGMEMVAKPFAMDLLAAKIRRMVEARKG